jgi:hypothetical protein
MFSHFRKGRRGANNENKIAVVTLGGSGCNLRANPGRPNHPGFWQAVDEVSSMPAFPPLSLSIDVMEHR